MSVIPEKDYVVTIMPAKVSLMPTKMMLDTLLWLQNEL